MHDGLLDVANPFVRIDSGRPRQAVLRRAISTASYALFHALCETCVTSSIGARRRSSSWSVISPLYRSVDHGAAKRVFVQVRARASAQQELRRLSEAFLTLQEARLRADYDPEIRFVRADAVQLIDEADHALALLRALSPDVRLELVVQLLAKQR